MDILKIQYPPGTIVKCMETDERLRIEYYNGNKVYLQSIIDETYGGFWDYFTHLGIKYTKDKTAQVLYGS